MFKVVYFSRSGRLYGDNKALLNIFDGLEKLDINPFVVVSEDGPFINQLRHRNIDFIKVNYLFSIYPKFDTNIKNILLFVPRLLRMLYLNNKAVKLLEQKLSKINPDIIHTNVGPIDIGYRLSKKLNIPHIWHLREYQDLDFGMHIFPSKRMFLKKLEQSHIISITHGVLNHFAQVNRLSNFTSKVIYDGVLSRLEIREFYKGERRNYLFVGRIEQAKGIDVLIQVIIYLKNKENVEITLDIAGEGNLAYIAELKKLIKLNNIDENINFLGYRKDIGKLMNESKALIVPSRYEGFGFITVEAMYNNCLVIGRNTGGTQEILESKNLGLLFNTKEELINVIKKVEQNGSEYYKPMIESAFKEALKLYSKERNIEEIVKYYSEILNEKES